MTYVRKSLICPLICPWDANYGSEPWMGALGKHSRIPEPLIFVTGLVAFFQVEGWSKLTDDKKAKKRGDFFGFSRTAYGLVKTRTEGRRLLVCTDSGNMRMKEAHAYGLDETGAVQPVSVLRA